MPNINSLQKAWSPEDYAALLRDIGAEPTIAGSTYLLDLIETERLAR